MIFSRHQQQQQHEPTPRHCGMTDLGAFVLGAGLMYVLDPSRGRRRRAVAGDKSVRYMHELADAADVTTRDLWNRTCGVVAELRGLFRGDDAPDEVIRDRIRARMGRVASHPSAIRVNVVDGMAILSGPILRHEQEDLIDAVRHVRGVRDVVDQLEPHKQAGDVPALQGGRQRPRERLDVAQENWSPTTRLFAGAGGAGLAAYGLKEGGVAGTLAAAIGASLALRATTNLPAKRLTGVGAGRQAVQVRKHINVAASPELAYAFWSNYENFPHFMHHVREVRHEPGRRQSHWVVTGPAGATVEWDAVETRNIPGRLIAWKTLPGAAVASAGLVRFDSNPDGTTRIDVTLSYNPPLGALGHAVATIFGANPKTEMDADLNRMKTLLETGNLPRDAAQPIEGAQV